MSALTHKPYGWEIIEENQLPNRVRGKIEFSPKDAHLYLSEEQNSSYDSIIGYDLKEELRIQNNLVYGANLLDYLLVHPEIIPEEYKRKMVFFWGTIYRNSDGYLFVRCLLWAFMGCSSYHHKLEDIFSDYCPTAVTDR